MSDIVVTEWGRVEDRIRDLEARVAGLTAERNRYRAALVEYSTWAHWQPCPALDGSEIMMLCDWIGGGEGPDIAEKALAGATESEAS